MTRDAIKEFSVKSVHCCTEKLKDLDDESSHQKRKRRRRERGGVRRAASEEALPLFASQLTKIKYNFYKRQTVREKNDIHELTRVEIRVTCLLNCSRTRLLRSITSEHLK